MHYRPKPSSEANVVYSKVDDHDVPIPHFGIVGKQIADDNSPSNSGGANESMMHS